MDIESEILQDLSAPIPSFRLIGIEKAIQNGRSQNLLTVLERQENLEDHEECRILLGYAVDAVRRRLHETTPETPVISLPAWSLNFEQGDSSTRMALLSGLTHGMKQGLFPSVPGWVEKEQDPAVAAFLIRSFQSVWSPESLDMLKGLLSASTLSLRNAALETLVSLAPDMLVELLPGLLTSEDIRTRTLALRGMAAIDPNEAVSYFEILLLEGEACEKEAAFRLSILLPFDQIKPALLKFLALEKDLKLVEKAGWLFQNNPDLEVPMRIWEIAEHAEAAKAALLKTIIQDSCRNLRLSGTLKEAYPEFVAGLQEQIRRRSAVRFVQEALERLEGDSAESRAEIEGNIRSALRNPLVSEAFNAALEWPISDRQKDHIRELLRLHSAPPTLEKPGSPAPPFPSPEEFGKRSLEEKIRTVSSWPEDAKDSLKVILKAVFSSSDAAPDLVASCVRASVRASYDEISPLCRKWARHANPSLASAAIEYLGCFDLDYLTLHMGNFLTVQNSRVKSATIKVLKKIDPAQAVSTLKVMLGNPDPEQKKLALSCMIHFDFFLVRPCLVEFLAGNTDPELLEAGLCFFQANSDPENLYALFSLEKSVPKKMSSAVIAFRRLLEKTLVAEGKLPNILADEQQAVLEKRWQTEQAGKTVPKPAYSLQNIDRLRFLLPKPEAAKRLASLARGLLTLGLIMFLSVLFWAAFTPGNPSFQGNTGRALGAFPVSLTGEIQNRQTDTEDVFFQGSDGTRFSLIVPPELTDQLNAGERGNAVLIPFRVGADGVVIAHLSAFKKLP
jgi:HEAT repeat protein